MLRRAKARIEGHLNYYAVTDNLEKMLGLSAFCHEDIVQVAQPQKPAKDLHLERLLAGSDMGWVAKNIYPQASESAPWLKDTLKIDRRAGCMGNPLVRFCAGAGEQPKVGLRYCGTAGKPGGKQRKQTSA